MKKIFTFALILLILVSTTVFPVNAEEGLDSKLNVSYTYDAATQKISIIANFVDITAKEGLIGLEYDVKYDPNILELVKAEPIYPKRWDTLIGSGAIEDLSGNTGNGVFHWSFVVIALGEGIKNDNELGIRLEFKPLKNESTKVEFLYDDLITEVIEDGMTLDLLHVSGSNAVISIDFDTPENPNVNQSQVSHPEASQPEESHPEESHPEVSQPETSQPQSSQPEESEPTSSDVESSVPNTSEEISEPEESETTSSNSETPSAPNTSNQFDDDNVITMPSISVEITDGHTSSVLSDDSSDNSIQGNNNGWLIWAILGGILLIALIVLVFVKFRKEKK